MAAIQRHQSGGNGRMSVGSTENLRVLNTDSTDVLPVRKLKHSSMDDLRRESPVHRRSLEQLLSTTNTNGMTQNQSSGSLNNMATPQRSKSTREARVGDYMIGETLGKGRYSVVKLAKHRITGELVAMKIVAKAKLSKEDMRVLQREMQIMKLLDHPNIVKLYEVIDTADHFYLVLEYVNGSTLTEELARLQRLKKKRKEEVVRNLFVQLMAATAYCHQEHVVHRDIKPDNLMIDEQGHVKLADWGFSNVATDLLNTHCGTPYYASPELFRPQAYAGPPSDVWACGVLLYYMYCGKLPFRSEPIREFISRGEYSVPKDVPPTLQGLIVRMLTVDAKRRITAHQILSHPWVLAGQGTQGFVHPQVNSIAEGVRNNHDEVIALMEHLGFSPDEVRTALECTTYDQTAATYFLLRDSPNFDKYKQQLATMQLQQQLQQQQQQLQVHQPTPPNPKSPLMHNRLSHPPASRTYSDSGLGSRLRSISLNDVPPSNLTLTHTGSLGSVSVEGSPTPQRTRSRTNSASKVLNFLLSGFGGSRSRRNSLQSNGPVINPSQPSNPSPLNPGVGSGSAYYLPQAGQLQAVNTMPNMYHGQQGPALQATNTMPNLTESSGQSVESLSSLSAELLYQQQAYLQQQQQLLQQKQMALQREVMLARLGSQGLGPNGVSVPVAGASVGRAANGYQ